uniref:FRIGIDA-like protein 4a n=1 Tax=Erigeron canadensis TaxID=72917 RepID=UPI001CB9A11B|nr:FRIGIDA-like protein 4a [Erigeron canadensis]
MTIEYPDKLKNFFNELETKRTLITIITETHNKLINNFISLDETLTKRSQILDTQMDIFKKTTQKTIDSIKSRENSLSDRESNMVYNVRHLKDSAMRDIVSADDDDDTKDRTTLGVLKMLFRRMDAKNLVKFLLEKRKEGAFRDELVAAMGEAVDLFALVLEAVEEFVELKVSGRKVTGMADRRWVYGVLVQAALPLPDEISSVGGGGGVGRSLKDRAMAVLEIWKGVLGSGDGGGGAVGSVEGAMFLQMVVGFGLKEKFDEGFLKGLVLEFASRREMPKLAVALGFQDKMNEIVEELVKTGKGIEAAYFACEAGLTEQFPPVPLLKSTLRKHREKTAKLSSTLEDALTEVNVIKTVLKCIEDHKLESHFTIDNLEKRLAELDRVKQKKKTNFSASTSGDRLGKRSRSEWGGRSSRPPKAIRLALAAQQKKLQVPPSTTRYSAPYNYANPYESNPVAPSYGGQSPGRYGLQHSYLSQVPTSLASTYQH